MRDKDLYAQILGITSPWQVTEVELLPNAGEVKVHVSARSQTNFACPKCESVSRGYDKRRRQWRHLDTCQYKTILVADVPRVECAEHGVVTVSVPWSEPGSGFTALFEALVIDWLQEASTQAVSRRLSLSWNAIDGIRQRAVKRGLARRARQTAENIGVDETAFRKGHDYVTIVSDHDRGIVLHVGQDRTKGDLTSWYQSLAEEQRSAIRSVSMDMWPAYIGATLASLADAENKIAFDKFHIAKYLGQAVDTVRRQEHKALKAQGDETLKGSKYAWLYNPNNMTRGQRKRFEALRDSALKTSRAWAIKTLAMSLWRYVSKTWARKAWQRWYGWAIRSRLEPVKKVAKTIKDHLWGILNAVVLKVGNGPAESLNSRIKMIKIRGRGFRNKERFANAIYFHLGGLDLYPDGVFR